MKRFAGNPELKVGTLFCWDNRIFCLIFSSGQTRGRDMRTVSL